MSEGLDPWATTLVSDYEEVMERFGIRRIDEKLMEVFGDSPFFRRGVIFAHRDLERVADAVISGREYAVITGIKPTGPYHLGTFQTAKEFVYFQKRSTASSAVFAIADVEAWEDNGQFFDVSREVAVDNVADLLAAGLDPERAYIYFQSREARVQRMAVIAARGITMATMRAVYGERGIGLYLSALIQVGDILLPQHPDLGGPKPTVVPVGIDQDPHIRLTRDVAGRMRSRYGLVEPSSTYHLLMRSLLGDKKMSKRDPMSFISMADDPDLAYRKVMNAFTGGRDTAEEQRRLGGDPTRCVVYELARFHLYDDEELKEMWDKCVSGERLCGPCKREVAERMALFLREHRRRKEEVRPQAEKIVEAAAESLNSGW